MKKRALCPGQRHESLFRPLISFIFLIASFFVLPALCFSENMVTIESIGSSAVSADNSVSARDASDISRKAKYRVAGFTSKSIEDEGAG